MAQAASENKLLVNGQENHILQFFVNGIINRLLVFCGYRGLNMSPLQALDAIFGSAGVAIFFLLLNGIFKNKAVALLGCLGLAFSREYWVYSTILETHIIPTALLISCLYFINRTKDKYPSKEILIATFFYALALYYSEVYIFFMPAIFSFIWLKGRCRYCHKRISWQYPAVEILSGFIWLGVFYKNFNGNFQFPISNFQLLNTGYEILIFSILLIIAVYDAKWRIIPDKIVYFGIAVAFLYNLARESTFFRS